MTDLVKPLEEQFNIFCSMAVDYGMDLELHDNIPQYFENLQTQAAFVLFTRAYWLGIRDADKEHWL